MTTARRTYTVISLRLVNIRWDMYNTGEVQQPTTMKQSGYSDRYILPAVTVDIDAIEKYTHDR